MFVRTCRLLLFIYTSYHTIQQPVRETAREKRFARLEAPGQIASGGWRPTLSFPYARVYLTVRLVSGRIRSFAVVVTTPRGALLFYTVLSVFYHGVLVEGRVDRRVIIVVFIVCSSRETVRFCRVLLLVLTPRGTINPRNYKR